MKNLLTCLMLITVSLTTFAQGYNGLIARWPFNGNANDVSGHSLNGVASGTTNVAGYGLQPNGAFHFDGDTSNVFVPFDTLMNLTRFSICVLVRPDTFYSGVCQGNTILYRGNTGAVAPSHYGLNIFDNGYDNDCNTFSPDNEVFSTEGNSWSVPTPSWYDTGHIAHPHHWYCVVAEGQEDSVFLYVGGVRTKAFPTSQALTTSSYGISIGKNNFDNTYTYPFKGDIDEIRLYNRVLSAPEVNTFCDSVMQITTAVETVKPAEAEVAIYPNPAHNNIKIHFSESNLNGSVRLLNGLGQAVAKLNIAGSDMYVDLSGLPGGMYYIECNYEGRTTVQKVLKQ